MSYRSKSVALLSLAMCASACGGDDTAAADKRVTVLLEAEDTITEGLDPGMSGEAIQDGWTVRFDNYVVTIGHIELKLSTDATVMVEDDKLFAVDLVKVPQAGLPLWTLSNLQAGNWDFHYSTLGSGDGAEAHSSVSSDIFDQMKSADATYYIAGSMTHPMGKSCPPKALATVPTDKMADGMNAGGDSCYAAPKITFAWLAEAETSFGPCEIDEKPGVSVAADTSVAATIHGDHMFFNGFPEADEGGVSRLAQYLADCDLDLDGVVTEDELKKIKPADLPELDSRYQLGGSLITPIDNMWTYLRAQLKTQGHFQGEGECPADGKAHDH